MSVFTTKYPDFRFSGLYYPQVFAELLQFRRAYIPELSDEDPNDPVTQLQSSEALLFHWATTLLDHVALETLFVTSRLRETLRGHLALIGYRLKETLPSSGQLLAELNAPVTSDTVIPDGSYFATQNASDEEVVVEVTDDVTVYASDELSYGYEDDGGSFTDETANLNGAGSVALWGGTPAAGDAVYFGHASTMFDGIELTLSTVGDLFDDINDHVWEYYDASVRDTVPTGVTYGGGTLTFDLTTLLGANDRHGADVVIICIRTGVEETVTSTYSGGVNKAVTSSAFGQTGTPSTDPSDYIVGVRWKEVPGLTETFPSGKATIAYTLPVTLSRLWTKTTVNGASAYWLRLRAVNATSTAPTITLADITSGDQYVLFDVSQGRTQIDDPAGTTDGTVNQQFTSTLDGIINDTMLVDIDEGSGYVRYSIVDDFLSSAETARDVTVDYDEDSLATITLGDGESGTVPPSGSSVRLTYRYGASSNGNIGAGTSWAVRTAPSFVSTVTNPRALVGWAPPEGSTDESIAALKVAGPASLRNLERAVSKGDFESLAKGFLAEDGTNPVKRAVATPDGLGDKTVRLLVVGASGAAVPTDVLEEIDDYFNGSEVLGTNGVAISGLQVGTENYIPRVINVTATATAKSGLTVDTDAIESAISAFLLPDSVDADGNYNHDFEGTVNDFQLLTTAGQAEPALKDLTLVGWSDVTLLADELPYPGAITVT